MAIKARPRTTRNPDRRRAIEEQAALLEMELAEALEIWRSRGDGHVYGADRARLLAAADRVLEAHGVAHPLDRIAHLAAIDRASCRPPLEIVVARDKKGGAR
jgi:hypothetical protein